VHEIKFDGYRTLAFLDGGKVRLVTRSGLDWTGRYGNLPKAFGALSGHSAILDGEIVVVDEKGISRFSRLQQALSDGPGDHLVFFAFDLLFLDGRDLRSSTLIERKQALAELLACHANPSTPLQVSEHFEGDAEALFDRASELGLEGIVSKRVDAPYVSGRSKTWIKVKAMQAADFIIAGYLPSTTGDGVGSLALASWVEGELEYRGKVGTGFTSAQLDDLFHRLEPLRYGAVSLEGAGKGIVWVRPVLTAHVHYATLTRDNSVRHAVFKGLREAPRSAGAPTTSNRKRLITDADLAGLVVTNPSRRMFGRSGGTKLDIAVYYAAVGDFLLPHLLGRPVSLLRCPTGKLQDCFFQRHAFQGMPSSIEVFETQNSDEEDRTYLALKDAKGYLGLAQLGVVEFHSWGTHLRNLDKPDTVVFDLDPGEGIGWREIVEAAIHVRGDLQRQGLKPFVKTSGGKGLHVVVPLKPKLGWKHIHLATGKIAEEIARGAPETFTTVMGASNRKRRIFIDFHRNARSATAAAPYTLRAKPHLPVSTPLDWADLESIDSPDDLNYASVPQLLTSSGDPWADINASACELPASSKVGK
jgi:bifunctional non-homologous end joining protein LigD